MSNFTPEEEQAAEDMERAIATSLARRSPHGILMDLPDTVLEIQQLGAHAMRQTLLKSGITAEQHWPLVTFDDDSDVIRAYELLQLKEKLIAGWTPTGTEGACGG